MRSRKLFMMISGNSLESKCDPHKLYSAFSLSSLTFSLGRAKALKSASLKYLPIRPFSVLKNHGDFHIWIEKLNKHCDLNRHFYFEILLFATMKNWGVSPWMFISDFPRQHYFFLNFLNFDGPKQALFSWVVPLFFIILHISLIVSICN